MYKQVKLTKNEILNAIILAFISLKFKIMTSEKGTYNYLVHDSFIFENLSDYFNINPLYKKMFIAGLDWSRDLETLFECQQRCSNGTVVYLDKDSKFELNSLLDLNIFASLVAEKISNDTNLLIKLGVDKGRLDKYRIKCNEETINNDGSKSINVIVCKSFDDGAKIFSNRKVLWENEKFYYIDNYPIIYKK